MKTMLTILFCNVQKCKEEKPQKHNNYSIFSFGIACHNFTRIILTVCVENFSLNKVYISNISKLKNIICLNVCSEQSLIPLASRTNIFFLKQDSSQLKTESVSAVIMLTIIAFIKAVTIGFS